MWEKTEEYHNNLYLPGRFSVRFGQRLLNNLLLCDEVTDYLSSEFPQQIMTQPQIRLTSETVALMGQVRYKGITSVLTVGFSPTIINTGHLKLAVQTGKIGLIPLPDSFVENNLTRTLQQLSKGQKTFDDNVNITEKLLSLLLELVENGQAICQPVYRTATDRFVRITAIELGEGYITLEFQPLTLNQI